VPALLIGRHPAASAVRYEIGSQIRWAIARNPPPIATAFAYRGTWLRWSRVPKVVYQLTPEV